MTGNNLFLMFLNILKFYLKIKSIKNLMTLKKQTKKKLPKNMPNLLLQTLFQVEKSLALITKQYLINSQIFLAKLFSLKLTQIIILFFLNDKLESKNAAIFFDIQKFISFYKQKFKIILFIYYIL